MTIYFSTTSEMASSTDAAGLPDEMWLTVFEYLLVDDRKNVRLTCRRFYDIANCTSLLRSEEIVFLRNVTATSIGLLTNSRRKIWNLKFIEVNFTADSALLSFFHNQGANVHSLILDECAVMVPELLKYLIVSCPNLRSFAISVEFEDERPINYIFEDFNSLRDNGITRQHVSSFSLTIKYNYNNSLSNAQFFNFFSIFTNIKELCLICLNYYLPGQKQFRAIPSRSSEFSFSGLWHQLFEMRHQLEKLRLTINSFDLEKWDKISLIEMVKLKELSIDRFHIEVDEFASNPILNFKHLTVFDCSIKPSLTIRDFSESTFILHLLNTNTELYFLSIKSYSHVLLTKDCFRALVGSRLKTLFLQFGLNDSELISLDLPPNYTLQRMKLDARAKSSLILFTTYFRCLEKLEVDTDENILSNIFQYQTKLRHLTIRNQHYSPRSRPSLTLKHLQQWLNNTGSLCRQLNHLTNLHLIHIKSLDLPEFLLIQFKFPKLRAFSIIFCNMDVGINSNVDLFWQSIQKLTQLEYLEIQWGIAISLEQFSSLCCSLSKLKYFLYFKHDSKPFGMRVYHEFFQKSPLLRVIIHGDPKSYSVKYSRDIGTNTVKNLLWPQKDDFKLVFIYEEIPQKYFLCENYPTDCHDIVDLKMAYYPPFNESDEDSYI